MSIGIDRWWKNTWCQVSDTSRKYIITIGIQLALELPGARSLFLSLSIIIYIVMPEAAFKTVRWLDRFIGLAWLIPWSKLMSIDIDDERYTMSSIRYLTQAPSVPSLTARSNLATLVTRCSCKTFRLFLPSTLFLYLPTHLSLPTWAICTLLLLLVNVTRSRSPTKNLQRQHGTTLATRSCHGRLGPWTMLYLVWTDGRQARVRLPVSSSIAMLSE